MMRRLLLLMIMAVMLSEGFAQQLKAVSASQQKQMIQRIDATAARLKTIQCDFRQVRLLSFLNDKMVSQGVMCYDARGKLRWQYIRPYDYLFVINDGKVHIKSGKNSNTIDIRSSRMFQSIAKMMMNSVTGNNLSNGDEFSVRMYTKGADWVAYLSPKKKEVKKVFQGIYLTFDSGKNMVKEVEMIESNGDHTLITLEQIKTNIAIDEKMFGVR